MRELFDFRSSKCRMLILAIVDICTIVFNSFIALLVRHEFHIELIPKNYLESISAYMIPNIIITLLIFWFMKLYRSVWTFASTRELVLIVGASILSTVFQAFGMTMLELSVPRSYYMLFFFFLVATTTTTRFSYRALRILKNRFENQEREILNTMVVGAGEAGSIIIREMQVSRHLSRKVSCIIDDNPNKWGRDIEGIPVVGGRDEILRSVEKYQIVLAIPTLQPSDRREILRLCNKAECKLKVLPGVYQLINEEVSVSKLRDVSIEDLLGRDSVQIDLSSVEAYLNEKTILVTGGGGSIGSDVVRSV